MSLSVIFPANMTTEAQAYLDHLNSNNPDSTPGSIWGVLRFDKHGRAVVPFMGPDGHAGGQLDEPEGAAELRAGAELSDTIEWPAEN